MIVTVVFVIALAFSAQAVDHHQKGYKKDPTPYEFSYGIDGNYGPSFAQKEKSDGKVVQGSYTVALPDGRRQIVEYVADHYNGYVAKIRYEGVAKYPSKVGKPITFFDHKSKPHH